MGNIALLLIVYGRSFESLFAMIMASVDFSSPSVWVTFAVAQESVSFRKKVGNHPRVRILHTGMGPTAAERAILEAFRTGINKRFHRISLCGVAAVHGQDLAGYIA